MWVGLGTVLKLDKKFCLGKIFPWETIWKQVTSHATSPLAQPAPGTWALCLLLQCTRVPPSTGSLHMPPLLPSPQAPAPPLSLLERKLHHAYKVINPLLKCYFHMEAILISLTRPNPLVLTHNLNPFILSFIWGRFFELLCMRHCCWQWETHDKTQTRSVLLTKENIFDGTRINNKLIISKQSSGSTDIKWIK